MKLEVTLASGIRLAFEGEREDFDHMADLLGLAEVIGAGLKGAPMRPLPPPPGHGGKASEEEDEEPVEIDVRVVSERLEAVGASKHTERITVMAQVAVEAGMAGIDYATAERLYRAIGEPKPGNWKSAFSNARVAGLIQSVGRGLWRPTTRGENYALYGEGATRTTARRRSTKSSDPETDGGGEDD